MTVLLLHALPLDERMWEPQRAAFPDAVAPRLYGRGASMEGWARGILEEVEGEFTVVGASMGGYCALELVRQAPERVGGLVLLGSRVEADSPELREGRAKTLELIRSGGAEALWEDMRPKLFPPGDTDAVLFAAGREDPFVSPEEAPPSVEVRAFDTGHLPSLERPEELNAVLAEFLARV